MKGMKRVGVLFILLLTPAVAAGFDMIAIPPGPFTMGNDDDPAAKPERRYMLGGFQIDRFEVTNAEFAAQFPDHTFPQGAEEHPVSHVSWNEADAFCKAAGKRLPTDAEWEKAARGNDGRAFPWGEKERRRMPHPEFSGVVKRRPGTDKKDVSPYGVQDMAGSLWEWIAEGNAEGKFARGGLWNLHLDFRFSKTWEKIVIPPDERFSFLGFRCAQ